MLTQEAGPFDIFIRLREHLGISHDEFGKPIAWPDGSVLACLYCTSVWIALLMLVIPKWAVRILAYSGAAIMVEAQHGKS